MIDESEGNFSVILSDWMGSFEFSGGRDPPARIALAARGLDGDEFVAGRNASWSFVLGMLFVGISDGSSIF